MPSKHLWGYVYLNPKCLWVLIPKIHISSHLALKSTRVILHNAVFLILLINESVAIHGFDFLLVTSFERIYFSQDLSSLNDIFRKVETDCLQHPGRGHSHTFGPRGCSPEAGLFFEILHP